MTIFPNRLQHHSFSKFPNFFLKIVSLFKKLLYFLANTMIPFEHIGIKSLILFLLFARIHHIFSQLLPICIQHSIQSTIDLLKKLGFLLLLLLSQF